MGRVDRELPEAKRAAFEQAVRVARWSIAFFASAVTVLALTLGSSQAMKAAWVEDMLGFVPPVAFLVAARYRTRPANERFQFGYHRAVGIGYLTAAMALLGLGGMILFDSVSKLVRAERAPIESVTIGGQEIWLGWLMLLALAYTIGPSVVLGRVKRRLARELHDKVLYADAEMNRADWMTAAAAMAGVAGLGLGWWWADGVAATLISLDIVRDGGRNVRAAVRDLMDARPRSVDERRDDPIVVRAENMLRSLDWVRDARVRLREEGHVFIGDALVVPRDGRQLVERLAGAVEQLGRLDWRLHDIVVMPVRELEAEEPRGDARAV